MVNVRGRVRHSQYADPETRTPGSSPHMAHGGAYIQRRIHTNTKEPNPTQTKPMTKPRAVGAAGIAPAVACSMHLPLLMHPGKDHSGQRAIICSYTGAV